MPASAWWCKYLLLFSAKNIIKVFGWIESCWGWGVVKTMFNKLWYHCREWQSSKIYLFIVWLYLKIYNVNEFFSLFLLRHYSASFNGGCLQHYSVIWLLKSMLTYLMLGWLGRNNNSMFFIIFTMLTHVQACIRWLKYTTGNH